MKKLFILVIGCVLMGTPNVIAQESHKIVVGEESAPMTISVYESTIQIKNASQQILEIYNIAGIKVSTIRIDSPSKTIELNDLPKGCYILKIGKVARKVYLR